MVGLVVWWQVVSASIVVVDSYSESNSVSGASTNISGTAANGQEAGQTFTSTTTITLNSAKFHLSRTDTTVTGVANAKLYAISGTYGTNSIPTGSVLATSDNFDVTTIDDTKWALYTFNFSGANRYVMQAGTYYAITVEYLGGSSTKFVQVNGDTSSPTHGGNIAVYKTSWTSYNTVDYIFYVYGDNGGGSSPVLVNDANNFIQFN